MIVRRVSKIPVRGRPIHPDAVRDLDCTLGRYGTPGIDVWIAARLLAGMRPEAVVVASGNTMSERSAYRWRKALIALEEVELGGHVAVYALRRRQPPVRLTPWTKVGDNRVDTPHTAGLLSA